MKAVLIVVAVIIVGLLLFSFAQGRSLRRASVYSSVSELLSAEQAFREQGIVTNSNRGFRAFHYTNVVTMGSTNFECEIAVEADWIRDFGFVALAKDGTVLWIDREFAACIARTAGGQLSMPKRFR